MTWENKARERNRVEIKKRGWISFFFLEEVLRIPVWAKKFPGVVANSTQSIVDSAHTGCLKPGLNLVLGHVFSQSCLRISRVKYTKCHRVFRMSHSVSIFC